MELQLMGFGVCTGLSWLDRFQNEMGGACRSDVESFLQHKGLTMEAPTSPILSEFYLQFLEN
jgi:hypothetical protein